jgi:hypothetical protein
MTELPDFSILPDFVIFLYKQINMIDYQSVIEVLGNIG